jgi:hypothetical protein
MPLLWNYDRYINQIANWPVNCVKNLKTFVLSATKVTVSVSFVNLRGIKLWNHKKNNNKIWT